MSFLIRILIPDAPGSLGRLAEAIGAVGGNIKSVDIVETFHDRSVLDDIVVELPSDIMADTLITAASSIDGVVVDSIRPFSGRVDRRGQIQMLSNVASHANDLKRAMQELVNVIPQAMTVSWAIVLDDTGKDTKISRVAAAQAAPEDDGSNPTTIDVTKARILNPETEEWIPASWGLLDSSLAVTPLNGTGMVLVVGRTGGPDFLASEVDHLGHVGQIVGSILT
ncbi:amino acid-binding ACT domain protein [Corynebacterium alimapuense]|uniref:Amino acid-binding ACT domain protein n=1 Tax=Corynebacterium alimapuense TaxID=1576874 RepID=A0A3M8K724_9CORY|nr:amino acid-binding ACT domain protein [Corynebacterium alimapuense]RNE48372.1 amino acid-binding ACT domain protein [Corynebacterium alimapuense]